MATDTTDAPFAIRSLVGNAGVGSNGEKLVNAIAYFYPPELEAAQRKRPNTVLTERLDRDEVSRIAGSDLDVADAVVRGGDRSEDDAWVTYAGYDANGDTVKGAFPYTDLGKRSSDRHVSQRDRLQESEAARDHRHAQAKADAATSASPDVDALRDQLAALEQRLSEVGDPEPVKDYGKATAKDIATMVSAADRATAARVLEYEQAHEKRSTVTDAVEKRIKALADEDAAAVKAQEALASENEKLKARLAELEAADKDSGGKAAGS